MTTRGATWRGPRTREAFHGAVALALFLSVGCTSNRFRLANDPRIDRNSELAAIDARTRQVPAAPTGLPVAPAIAATETPDGDVALNDTRPLPEDPVPAATYPPRASSPPFVETDPDGAIAQGDRLPDTALGSRARMDETPRPGAKGTQFAPVVAGPQIAGRVVNPYGKPEPNASIQIFDLSQNRRLVAETAAGADGRFRAQNLEPGRQYEVAAASTSTANRLFGSTVAVPPDGSAVVRLEPEHRTRTGSTFGSLEKFPGAKALQGLVKAPNPEPQPISDNVRISGPRLVAAGRTNTSTSEESELTNAVAQERPPVMTEPVKLPSVGERTRELASATPKPAAPTYQPPRESGAVSGKLTFPIIYRDGTPGVLEQLPGDIILVDFWGTWCGPCKKAVPHLNELHQKYSARGLHIIGVAAEHGSRGEQLQQLEKARQVLKIQYTAALCPGALGEPCPLRSAFSISKFPTFVLIDRSGRVIFSGQGASGDTLARLDRAIGSYLSSVGR
jgi:thiol-disulfide isomerase/thioredoxin